MAAREEVAACRAEAWNWMVRPSVTNTSYHFDGGSGTLVTSPALIYGFELAFLNGRARVAQGAPGAILARWIHRRGSAPTLPTSSGHRARTFAVSTMITREPTRKLIL